MRRLLRPLAAVIALAPIAPAHADEILYALQDVFGGPGRLHIVDPASATILSSVDVSTPGFDLFRCTALARRPSDGALFAVADVFPPGGPMDGPFAPQSLITIDPATGVSVVIGDLGDRFAAIAFRENGDLYGVTDDFSAAPERLYLIDPDTADTTFVLALGAGDAGETLAFAADGFLYHASGATPGQQFFQRINIDTQVISNLGALTNVRAFPFGSEVLSLGWAPALDTMFLAERGLRLHTINTVTGATSPLPAVNTPYLKGLAYTGGVLYGIDNPTGSGAAGPPRLYTLNPTTGATMSSIAVSMAGETLRRATGLAAHPTTGTLYAVVGRAGFGGAGARFLATLNPATGVAAKIGQLAEGFAGIAFRPDGTLIGVTGENATNPESLYIINASTAGASLLVPLGNGGDGEAIALGPSGRLFHASGLFAGDQYFEKIDLDSLAVDEIGIPGYGAPYAEPLALGFSPELDAMFLADSQGDLYSIDISGAGASRIGAFSLPSADGFDPLQIRGLAFAHVDGPCPGDTNGDRRIDFADLNRVLSEFGFVGPGFAGDVDGDGDVDFTDLNIVLSNYGVIC